MSKPCLERGMTQKTLRGEDASRRVSIDDLLETTVFAGSSFRTETLSTYPPMHAAPPHKEGLPSEISPRINLARA
eukprot:33478-Eustigmatos_ZCMA.PRE.1